MENKSEVSEKNRKSKDQLRLKKDIFCRSVPFLIGILSVLQAVLGLEPKKLRTKLIKQFENIPNNTDGY